MKKAILKFGGIRKSYLPEFQSRRGWTRHAAFKSGGGEGDDDDDLEEIKKEFNTFKQKVEGDTATKAGIAAKEAVKEYETRIKNLEKLTGLPEGVDGEAIRKMKTDLETLITDFEAAQMKIKDFNPAPVTKSFGTALREAMEEKTDEIAKMAAGDKTVKSISFEMDLKAVGDISTANVTGGTVWGANYKPGIIESPKRKVHMREVIPGGSVGAGTDYYFMKQNGPGEGGAAFTTEGASKPQSDEDLVESSVKIESLPVFSRVTRKAMNNIPGFTSFLQSRLVEKILKAEDAAILYGTGVSPIPKGILVAGNFTASGSTISDPLVEKIMDDISQLEDTVEREANLILLRPAAYNSFFKNKATGSGEYDLPANVYFLNGVLYIGGVPVKSTTALNAPDYIVGDFANGANWLTQESLRIEFFEQDADNVTKNKITVRAEETVALPIYGSDYFIKGTTATS